jgi:hypothetical protein
MIARSLSGSCVAVWRAIASGLFLGSKPICNQFLTQEFADLDIFSLLQLPNLLVCGCRSHINMPGVALFDAAVDGCAGGPFPTLVVSKYVLWIYLPEFVNPVLRHYVHWCHH